MRYCSVAFTESQTVETVPANWLEGTICFWPNITNQQKIIKLIKSASSIEEEWLPYEVKIYKTCGKFTYDILLIYCLILQ